MKVLVLLFALLFPAIALSQIEIGKPSELKGVKSIYVSANRSVLKETIAKEIKRQLPEITIADNIENAEALLTFRADTLSFFKGNPASELLGTTTSLVESKTFAVGEVSKRITNASSRRLLMFRESEPPQSERSLAKRFGSAFVRAYRAANNK